jgi:hypothetical protein
VATGKFDTLFSSGKISEFYWQSQHPPNIRLVKSEAYRPVLYELPKYPPTAARSMEMSVRGRRSDDRASMVGSAASLCIGLSSTKIDAPTK